MSDGGLGGPLAVELRAEIGEFLDNLGKGREGFKETVEGIKDDAAASGEATGGVFDRLGGEMATKLAAGAAVAGGIALKVGQDWNNMSKEMSVQTGATGAALDALQGSVQNVAGSVKGNMGDIGNVMSDVASKTDLTGPPLEDLTRRFLQLQDLGIDLAAGPVTATLAGWGVAAQDMAGELDNVFRASQTVGVPMTTITDRLQTMRPALQGMGFDLQSSTLLVGRLSEQALPGFNKALISITKAHGDQAGAAKDVAAAQKEYDAAVRTSGAGSQAAIDAAGRLKEAQLMLALGTQPPKEAFGSLVASIKNAATEQDALGIGMAAFGAKSAIPMTQAIRAGKFDLDALTASQAANTNTIAGTSNAHLTFIDRLKMVKEGIVATVGPVAEQAGAFAGIVSGAMPAVEGIKSVVGWVQKIRQARQAAAAASVVEAGAAALSTGPTIASGAAAGTASVGFFAFAAGVWAAIAPFLPIIAALVAIGVALYLLWDNWSAVWGFISGLIGTVAGFLQDHFKKIAAFVLLPLAPLLLLWDNWDAVWGFISGAVSGAWDILSGIFDSIVAGVEWVIEMIGRAVDAIADIPGMGVVGSIMGVIPGFATGGTVPGPIGSPQLAIVHGGETINRPSGNGEEGRGGGDTYVFNIAGSVLSERDLDSAIQESLGRSKRRGAAVGF